MDMKTYKRLPYGNSDFGSLMMGNYVYVDKTRFIEELENESNKNQFFIRPRKFGKSLFFSMMSYYYDINRADQFERLFGTLYIGRHPTPEKNRYLIMDFDFSGLDTSDENHFSVSFNRKIESTVRAFIFRYENLIPDAAALAQKALDADSGLGADALDMAFQAVTNLGRQIFVIIDEYDHFANDLIAMGTITGDDIYRRVVRANGLVRRFYERLKIATKTSLVNRIFITGISPVMLDDLTSGFNIAGNLTLECKYNEMMGFTGEEVTLLMEETGIDTSLINVNIEAYYNGYLFHEDGENRVYNPSMILYFFNQIVKNRKPPKNIIDDNLKTDYGRLQRLVQNEQNHAKLMEIAKGNGIMSNIADKFPIDRLEDEQHFVSLLFYMGLLTIDKMEEGTLRLKIPNYSIRTIYWEYFGRLTADGNRDVMIDLSGQTAAVKELAYRGNPHPYIEYVSQNIFSRLSNRDLRYFDEKYIKIMLLNGLFQSNLYVTVTEMEVSQGYTDIYMQRSHRFPEIPFEWVWEIKYVKKEEGGALQKKRDEARTQLEKYRRSHLFAGRSDVRFLSVIFIGKDKYELEELCLTPPC
jgi:hypothetical protein